MTRSLILVFLGGGAGSVLRWSIGGLIPAGAGFPWATLAANLLACALVGGALGLVPSPGESTRLLLLVGFCGGLSTFSAYSRETFQMLERGEWIQALAYVAISTVGGLAAMFLAWKALSRAGLS